MTIDRVAYARGGREVSIAVDTDPGRGIRPDLWPSVGEYPLYDPFLYYSMTHDVLRNDAFRAALRRVAGGRTVLDIGTGQDLNWALEAARHGARAVHAVEAIERSHAKAAERLARAPQRDRVELVHGTSFDLTLPERAEVCVAELIGSIASAEGMLAAVSDARARLLAPDAVVIPAACRTIAGAVSLRDMFPDGLGFSRDALPYLRKVFDLCGRPFDVRLTVSSPDPASVLSSTAAVETLRFDGSQPLDEKTDQRLTAERDGAVDGLLLWIVLDAGDGTRPIDSLHDRTSWTPAYLPLFDTPVETRAGDVLDVTFERRTSDDGVHPDYLVNASLTTSTGTFEGSSVSTHHGPDLGTNAIYRYLLIG
ncbi:class I SAM-dependent methyltransferase [Nonomuraea sp. PA05]|uniref:class I SAM-dependent methyltransferase n=1 Tax=Nonomuraea sp. PA05 TaxID=2604466 RepID=UPI0011D4AB06|nr:class I SAM-dependent methyltransferase [Nonomuraea sp. PA05]TYB45787.1 class I SAM-dependent methyltransferase [Nonomuraea sp. PA05]